MSLPLEKLPHRPVSGLKLTVGLIITLGLAGGIAAWGLSTRASNADRLSARAREAAIPTVLVVTPLKPSTSVMRFELPGRIEPRTRAPIFSCIAGYLKVWRVDIGASWHRVPG